MALRQLTRWTATHVAETIDCVVIGAGVVGLAIARALAQADREVLVLEQSSSAGTVIHGGLYYERDSLKAALCVEGKKLLYSYCREKGVPFKQCGKLIVATHPSQLRTLGDIMAQAKANGVDDVEQLERSDVELLEPHVQSYGACLSPSTGIIDSHALMHALQADAEAAGATFAFNSQVVAGDVSSPVKQLTVRDSHGTETHISAHNIVNSAGLYAWDVAACLKGYAVKYLPQRYFARGCYFALKGRAPFTRLIYPIPEPGGLGIHLTIDLQGKAKFGPDVEWIDKIDYTLDPSRVQNFYSAIRSYYPSLANDALLPDYTGIRPKNTGPGEPAADFLIQTHQSHVILGLIHLFGIESPGLTASLAIGEYIAEILDG